MATVAEETTPMTESGEGVTTTTSTKSTLPTFPLSFDEVTVQDLARERFAPVDCEYNRTVSEALTIMNSNDITALPIYAPEGAIPTDPNQLVVKSKGKQYIGIVSMLDICLYLINNMGDTTALNASIWQAVGQSTEGLTMVVCPPRSTLQSLIGMLSTGNIHRVLIPIQDPAQAKETEYRILSQTDIIKFALRELDTISRPVARRSVENLGLVSLAKPVFTVGESVPIRDALLQMQAQRVRSVAVVDFAGVISTSLTVEDLRGITPRTLQNMEMSVLDFTRLVRGGKEPAVTCAPDWSLAALMAHMLVHGVHRVFIVDPTLRPIGVVSQTDIINVFSTYRAFL